MTRMNGPVAIKRVGGYVADEVRQALAEALAALGGLKAFVRPGQNVLVKPNLIAARPASQTHPVVVVELARLIREFGCDVAVADSPAWASIRWNARRSGLLELTAANDIPLFELAQPVRVETGNPDFRRLTISRQALKADAVINVPKLKTHQQLGLTAGVKNMFGIVPGKRKAWWHFAAGRGEDHFARMIVQTFLAAKPVLTVIDAIEAMEGRGPIGGAARQLNLLIASQNAFAAELAACRLIGADPHNLPILRAGWDCGVAPERLETVQIVGGQPAEPVVDDFVFPPRMPVGFSLGRVAKSVVSQVGILTRNALGRP